MKEITIILFCTFKFAATFPMAIMIMKMSYTETILFTNIGGILGVILFAFASKMIIMLWEKLWPHKYQVKSRNKRIFSPKNRRFVKIKSKYGLPGIVVLNPVILSIPVGTFLVTKYYGRKIINYIWLITGQIGWSFVYAFFYMKIYTMF